MVAGREGSSLSPIQSTHQLRHAAASLLLVQVDRPAVILSGVLLLGQDFQSAPAVLWP